MDSAQAMPSFWMSVLAALTFVLVVLVVIYAVRR